MATVCYIGHSAFLVDTGTHALLFDYTGGKLPPVPEYRPILTFTSHAHADHYDTAALKSVSPKGRAFGFDIEKNLPGAYLRPGEETTLCGAHVRALGSTDQGVSFWVESGGWTIFHAGDLNLWHWSEESTPAEVRQAEADFERCIAPITGLRPDIAMFPVDPRMGAEYARGARRFCEAVRPRLILPMHFWNRPEAALAFAREPMPKGVQAKALVRSGESIEYNKEDETMAFVYDHSNLNVTNLERSLAFYKEALWLETVRVSEAKDGSFKLAFLSDGKGSKLELTWLRDHPQKYDLGENESHICFRTDEYEASHAKHLQMGCVCFENTAMGLYFIEDPDGYWLEITPMR